MLASCLGGMRRPQWSSRQQVSDEEALDTRHLAYCRRLATAVINGCCFLALVIQRESLGGGSLRDGRDGHVG